MKLPRIIALLAGRAAGPEAGSAGRRQAGARPASNPHPFHAVAVIPGETACAQAKVAAHIRLLSSSAPLLPLPGCSMPERCACHFHKYNDRRQEDRRLFGGERDDRWYPGPDRRRLAGRRSTDR